MADNFSQLNPLHDIYADFEKLLNTVVIKYSYLAEKYETFEIKKEADMFIAAKDGLDTFFTYNDYSVDELYAVGITDASRIAQYMNYNGYLQIPVKYRDQLLKNRRSKIIKSYVEKNDYYRMLNGYPSYDTPSDKFLYLRDIPTIAGDITHIYNIRRIYICEI